jgi:hypothetical protein
MSDQPDPRRSVHISGGRIEGTNIAIGNTAKVEVRNGNEMPFDALVLEIARLRAELHRTAPTSDLAVVVVQAEAAARDRDEGRLERALRVGGRALLAFAQETGAAFTAEQILRLLHG